METFQYPHFPQEVSTIYVSLFTDVKNSAHLRSRLIKAATMEGPEGEAEREAVNFAFVDAKLICSRLHLLTAVYHAILAQVQGSLRTRTVHSEVLWALNPSNNITEAIRRYGVSDDTKAMFVIRIDGTIHDTQEKMQAVIEGNLRPLDELTNVTDWASIRKYNKLNAEPAVQAACTDIIRQQAVIDEIVTSSVAMKSVMA